ncbi:MAG: adenylate/guanylate cyclase domain-containing protein [Spirochaetia bacterium]|nr:adenylate/guanylate cyclase domain-containing protein [Spirochaetia bacterium]
MKPPAKKKNHFKSHRRNVIIIGIVATLFSMVITRIGFFDTVELRSVDWRFKARGPIKVEAPVVIVAIDDESFANMAEKWTWPRSVYAQALRNLKNWGAKVVAFDVVFSEPTASSPEEDRIFAKALKEADNAVLGMRFIVRSNELADLTKAELPIDILQKSARGMGVVHHAFDADSHVRRTHIRLDHKGSQYYSLAFESLGIYKDYRNRIKLRDGNMIKWGDITAPLTKELNMYINFAGPPGTFETVPFYKVYYGEDLRPEMFRDKIVLIGSKSEILHDVFITPFCDAVNQMPGVEIHANVLNTLVSKNFISEMDDFSSFWLVIGLGILTAVLLFGLKTVQGLLVIAVEIIAYIASARYLFDARNFIVPFVDPLFTMVFTYLSMSTYKVAVEEREKKKIKDIFSKYVSQNLVEELLNREIKLGGEKKTITVLFSDIRGFTSMSEKMQPEEVVRVLNEYLTAMTGIVFRNKGTLDKFIGDAVMALFGTPAYYEDHALRAVKTAVMMQDKLNELNETWKAAGRPTLKIGVGVNTGEVIAGNMGSLQRMEYTVIGDTVNLASRLESLNKELGTEIIISSSTYELVKEHVKVKKFTGVKVKGKEDSLTVYQVLELAD